MRTYLRQLFQLAIHAGNRSVGRHLPSLVPFCVPESGVLGQAAILFTGGIGLFLVTLDPFVHELS